MLNVYESIPHYECIYDVFQTHIKLNKNILGCIYSANK